MVGLEWRLEVGFKMSYLRDIMKGNWDDVRWVNFTHFDLFFLGRWIDSTRKTCRHWHESFSTIKGIVISAISICMMCWGQPQTYANMGPAMCIDLAGRSCQIGFWELQTNMATQQKSVPKVFLWIEPEGRKSVPKFQKGPFFHFFFTSAGFV